MRLCSSSNRRLHKRARVLGAAVLATLALTPPLFAQRFDRGLSIQGAASDQATVYVRDSAIAADKFELGKRMERLKEWHKSADVYQEILEKFQDRVVPVQSNDRGQPTKYSSVTVAVQERLSRWPEEGLTVYRTRYEPNAASMMAQTRPDDYSGLHQIFSRYFATDTARDAGIRLIDLYMESGEFAAAAWTGDRLLGWHPNLTAQRASVLFRTALGYHLSGNAKQAKAKFDELRDKHALDIGTVGGKDVPLAQALEPLLAEKPPVAGLASGNSYATFGGGPTRNVVPTGGGVPGSKVWSVPIPPPSIGSNASDSARQAQAAQIEAQRAQHQMTTIIPAIDRGEMFFTDGQRVRGLQLESGVPLPGWVQTYGGRQPGQFTLPNLIDRVIGVNNDPTAASLPPQQRQSTVSLTDDSVLGVLGAADNRPNLGGNTGNEPGTRLVCLDRATGKLRWQALSKDLPINAELGAKNVSFGGSPLVVGENVYIIGRGSSGAGVEDCHVVCYEVATGKYRWGSYIASAQNGANINGQIVPGNETLSHLAFASGRIYVLTNVGAVAAVDAYSGATAWLTLYPRDESNNVATRQRLAQLAWGGGGWQGGMSSIPTSDMAKPWEFNPVIVHDGKVFVLPMDGRHLLIYDAASGDEIKRISSTIRFYASEPPRFDDEAQMYRVTMLLGVVGPHLVVGGPNNIFILDYEKLAPVKPGDNELTEESIYYHQPLGEVIGRPFLTGTQVFAPTKLGLNVIDIPKTRITHRYPKGGNPWPEGEGPGNVVATGDHVVITDGRSVNVYTDIEGIRQKYEAAITADPKNVEARLVFAELMFNAREFADARKSLDEAIEVLGGLDAMKPGALRDRVFGDALMFAQKLGADKTPQGIENAEALFDRAAAAAQNPSQQVNYRVTRAKFIDSLKENNPKPDYAKAAALYQEILASPEMRIIALVGEDGVPQQAGVLAEKAITDLKLKVGPQVYAKFEEEAGQKLAALKAAEKPDAVALLTLAENYPNADVARDAFMLAAEAFEKSEQPRLATQVLRRAYLKYGVKYPAEQKARLAEAMARNYLKVGNVGAAAGRLYRAAAFLPDAKLSGTLTTPDGKALLRPDGKPVETLVQAADALDHVASRQHADARLPDLNLPQPLNHEQLLKAVQALLRQQPGAPTAIPKEPVPFVAGSSMANVTALLEAPEDLQPAYTRPDRVVAFVQGKLACFQPGSASAAWSGNALSEGASGLLWLDQNRLAVWGEGELALLDGVSGKTTWRVELKSLPAVELIGAESLPNIAEASEGAGQAAQAQVQVQVDPRVMARNNLVFRLGGVAPGVMINPAVGGNPFVINNANLNVQPGQAKADDGKERVLHVRPLADRLIVSTTTGRVMAVSLEQGKPIWQTRLVSGPDIQQTLATDDFTAVRTLDGTSGLLAVLDSYTGQQVMRRAFSTSQRDWVMNAALAPDGALVWTSPQAMFAKDLYDGEEPVGDQNQRSYLGLMRPGQLLIHNREVFAVSDGGGFIDRRTLRGLRPVGLPLGTGTSDVNSRLKIVEGRLYVATPKSLTVYVLEQETNTPVRLESEVAYAPGELMVTKEYVLLPGTYSEEGGAGGRVIDAMDRSLVRNSETGKMSESGRRVYHIPLPRTAKVKAWQAVEGGLYYLTTENTLHFLKGARG